MQIYVFMLLSWIASEYGVIEDLVESGVINQVKQFNLEFHTWEWDKGLYIKMVKSLDKFEEAGFVKVAITKLTDKKDQALGEIPYVANMLLINKRLMKNG